MTSEEASQLKDYMRAVVDEGTATMLSGQSYSVAGKTGTAEYSMTDGGKNTFLVRRLYECGQPGTGHQCDHRGL